MGHGSCGSARGMARRADRAAQRGGLHRPDLVSLAFGLVFTVVGLTAVANPQGIEGLDIGLTLSVVAVLVGIGVVGNLLLRPSGSRPPAHPSQQEGHRPPADAGEYADDPGWVPGPHDPSPRTGPVVPTPQQVREEDAAWFGWDTPLTEAEAEVLAALAEAERAASEAPEEAQDPERGSSAGEGTADPATG